VGKENNKVYPNYHKQLLYVETKISSLDLKELKNKAEVCLENQNEFSKANNLLVGNMEKEFNLNESFEKILFPYSSSLADEFDDLNNKILDQPNTQKQVSNWVSTGSWINFQKKHEFNPLHDHSGDYSFVLWVQIPYDLKEELKLQNCKNSNNQKNSLFNFSFLNQYGQFVENSLPVDKTWEGTMILFPSNLRHEVYPFFTSDDYRISISGNLIKKTLSKKTFSYQYGK
jgi:hypothetical protein